MSKRSRVRVPRALSAVRCEVLPGSGQRLGQPSDWLAEGH